MNVTVLGAGTAGSALAARARDVGHTVRALNTKDAIGSVTASVASSDLVVLAIPFEAVAGLHPEVRQSLRGKTVVDLTNPLTPDFTGLTVGFSTSGGESVAAAIPGAHVIKALNTVLAPNFDPRAFPGNPVAPVAGNDPHAKAAVTAFVRSLGFDAVDAGPLRNSRYLEPLAGLLIQLAYVQGLGSGTAFALLRRPASE